MNEVTVGMYSGRISPWKTRKRSVLLICVVLTSLWGNRVTKPRSRKTVNGSVNTARVTYSGTHALSTGSDGTMATGFRS